MMLPDAGLLIKDMTDKSLLCDKDALAQTQDINVIESNFLEPNISTTPIFQHRVGYLACEQIGASGCELPA